MKPANIFQFYKLLRARGMSLTKLAASIGSTHSHLSQVVHGVPGRGGHTRRKLAPLLTREETDLLGWDEKGTLCHVEQNHEPANCN